MTDVNILTGRALRYGIILGLAVLAVGIITGFFSQDASMSVMTAGIAVIIFTPMASIVVSAVSLYLEKDYLWFGWVCILLVITAVGFAVAYLY